MVLDRSRATAPTRGLLRAARIKERNTMNRVILAAMVLVILPAVLWATSTDADILIADFEGKDYGAWKVTGEAFGKGPVHGTLPNQHPVAGFEGKGLVNSYLGGDGPRGTLMSPEFAIERK